jgi:hypothetical protein
MLVVRPYLHPLAKRLTKTYLADPKEVRKMKDGREANGIGKTLEPVENKTVELPASPNQIFIKSIPPNIGRHALEAVSTSDRRESVS